MNALFYFYYFTFDFASLYTLCVIGGLKLMCVADAIKFQVRKFTTLELLTIELYVCLVVNRL